MCWVAGPRSTLVVEGVHYNGDLPCVSRQASKCRALLRSFEEIFSAQLTALDSADWQKVEAGLVQVESLRQSDVSGENHKALDQLEDLITEPLPVPGTNGLSVEITAYEIGQHAPVEAPMAPAEAIDAADIDRHIDQFGGLLQLPPPIPVVVNQPLGDALTKATTDTLMVSQDNAEDPSVETHVPEALPRLTTPGCEVESMDVDIASLVQSLDTVDLKPAIQRTDQQCWTDLSPESLDSIFDALQRRCNPEYVAAREDIAEGDLPSDEALAGYLRDFTNLDSDIQEILRPSIPNREAHRQSRMDPGTGGRSRERRHRNSSKRAAPDQDGRWGTPYTERGHREHYSHRAMRINALGRRVWDPAPGIDLKPRTRMKQEQSLHTRVKEEQDRLMPSTGASHSMDRSQPPSCRHYSRPRPTLSTIDNHLREAPSSHINGACSGDFNSETKNTTGKCSRSTIGNDIEECNIKGPTASLRPNSDKGKSVVKTSFSPSMSAAQRKRSMVSSPLSGRSTEHAFYGLSQSNSPAAPETMLPGGAAFPLVQDSEVLIAPRWGYHRSFHSSVNRLGSRKRRRCSIRDA
ncbi:hypothetical protein BD324DRAFT_639214 [Kockovaella imperatae]|uniref:Uncharacterized protein n=1 Tax=Kockovaella imperatae TaxID=4999 RepID=A0A1Y1U6P2_9TREE|nr:hypothetical protein BD324DRAFT_639214 [Kockovaella imperatae]ORX33701.1 hypothetical protein BD324DRAFT_639214 [Kockovaella imperatae]